jgi:23S rRNA (uridine2552-2'-O)-methyltransferase
MRYMAAFPFARFASTATWLARQNKDPFVKAARTSEYKCRSAYKLLQIDARHSLFAAKCRLVVDVGAAPGSWTQVALQRGAQRIIAVDLLPMRPIDNRVTFVQGNFLQPPTEFTSAIKSAPANLILSDMAPNISGLRELDHARSSELVEAVINFGVSNLSLKGNLVAKLLSGPDDARLVKCAEQHFAQVVVMKPEATRKVSREIYLVCKNLRSVSTDSSYSS